MKPNTFKLNISSTLFIIVFLHIAIWYLAFYFLKVGDTFGLYDESFLSFVIGKQGEFYSTLLMTFLAFNISLACRFKFVERVFFGLDKVYKVHKYTAYFIVLLMIMHNVFIRGFSNPTGFFFLAREIANPLMYTMLLAIFVSAMPHIPYIKNNINIPYHIWKNTHVFMGALFVVGMYHSLGVSSFTFSNPTLSVYMYAVYVIGVAAYLYKSVLYKYLKKKHSYVVTSVTSIGDVLEVVMRAKVEKDKLSHDAGQFAFFEFQDYGISESHPFTISNADSEAGEVRISVKSLGDYTSKLKDKLKVGCKVLIEGPYGYFKTVGHNSVDYSPLTRGLGVEVWVAGGIGVTPFLAFLQEMKNKNINKALESKKINFIWTVKNKAEAVYEKEIRDQLPENVNFVLWNTEESGFINFENVKEILNAKDVNSVLDVAEDKKKENTSFYICGPEAMRESIIKKAKDSGFKKFYFEEFAFR